jgi:hypothetical protein
VLFIDVSNAQIIYQVGGKGDYVHHAVRSWEISFVSTTVRSWEISFVSTKLG